MKQIKFRAFDKKTKKIFPVSALHSNGAVHIDVYPDSKAEYKNADEVELMQFTGLHDKNGKEIYEGDICRYDNDFRFEVVFRKGSFCAPTSKNAFVIFDETQSEIIGNIYESPELLNPNE